jgi:predicted NAD/FAD-dependent oxidoreductase
MSVENWESDILIVGAGICGLMAAQTLTKMGYEVLLLEKSPDIGGRLATTRIGDGYADQGAQFFTVRSPDFRAWVDEWISTGLVYLWSEGWAGGSLVHQTGSYDHPRYVVRHGMNALAHHLSEGQKVLSGAGLTSISPTINGWCGYDTEDNFFTARAVMLTPPVPEVLNVLKAGHTDLTASEKAYLGQVSYSSCLSGLFRIDQPASLPEPGAIQHPGADVPWIADNRRKGISADENLVTVHASPDYSRRLWSLPDEEAIAALQPHLDPYLERGSQVLDVHLTRWQYALPTSLHPKRFLQPANLPTLVVAGDGFGGPRVEGAAISGLQAAQALAKSLA